MDVSTTYNTRFCPFSTLLTSILIITYNTCNVLVQAKTARGGVGVAEVELHAFLTSAPDGTKWTAFTTRPLYRGRRTTRAHSTGGWVGPSSSTNVLVKYEIYMG